MELNFSCNKCGKCCLNKPKVTFSESLQLSRQFVFQITHNGVLSHTDSPIPSDAIDHYNYIAHAVVVPEKNVSMFHYTEIIAIEPNSQHYCSKLVDGKCSIESSKPIYCQLMPINPTIPLGHYQDNQINYFKENIIKHDWKCDFSDNAFPYLRGGKLYTNSDQLKHVDYLNETRYFTDKYLEFVGLEGDTKFNQHLKSVFMAVQGQTSLVSDMTTGLQAMVYFYVISTEQAETFVLNQISLLEQKISELLSLKNKQDRNITDIYRKQLLSYKKAIEKDVFNYVNSIFRESI